MAALLDVNVLVALAGDSRVHHVAARRWFSAQGRDGWATCPITEAGFVRVSSNPVVLPAAISVDSARSVLVALRAVGSHRFVADDVSMTDGDVPRVSGYRQLTNAHLLTIARRNRLRLVTFDVAAATLVGDAAVELLSAL